MHTSGLLMVILTVGIIAIKALWIATEPRPWKERFSKEMISTNLLEIIILELQLISAIFFPFPGFGFEKYFMYVGIALYAAGMILAIWGRLSMDRAWGFPTEMEQKRQNFLVTGGPFTISRNPIYVGFVLIYFGYALALRSYFIILRLPMVWYFYKSVLKEEKNLETMFGKDYTKYKKKVPRFLLLKAH
jgi:protein-S-isoprenylcysteine O-methyltransferase Ste14